MLGYSRPPAKPASQRTRAITATKVVPWVPVKSVDLGPSFTGGYSVQHLVSQARIWTFILHSIPGSFPLLPYFGAIRSSLSRNSS